MQKFLNNILKGSSFLPPGPVVDRLYHHFENPVNIEWHDTADGYEAIFYEHQKECLARFDKEGKLQEYKVNLNTDALPETLGQNMHKKGEIMNVIVVRKGDAEMYEIIYRDASLNRFLMLLTSDGEEIVNKPL